jgi:hypothetical protein
MQLLCCRCTALTILAKFCDYQVVIIITNEVLVLGKRNVVQKVVKILILCICNIVFVA